jgi:hypothetical protein
VAVFVSSTFLDMQAERDALRDVVLPKYVAPLAEEYGAKVELIDLRWGVDSTSVDEAEQNRKVLSTCMDEIRRSQPFFIGFLGDRYGWTPDSQALAEAAAGSQAADWLAAQAGKSVTALEIEYAALASSPPGGPTACRFYFRQLKNPEALSPPNRSVYLDSPANSAKLTALKKEILDRFGAAVETYTAEVDENGVTSLGHFSEMVGQGIISQLRQEWGEPPKERLGEVAREIRLQSASQARRAAMFAGRRALLDALRAYGLSLDPGRVGQAADSKLSATITPASRLLLVKGAPGSGKSTLVGRLAAELSGDAETVTLFCGASQLSSSVAGLLRCLIAALGGAAELAAAEDAAGAGDIAQLRQLMAQALAARCQTGRVCLLIDGLDQLRGAEARSLRWLPDSIPENCRIICTLIEGEEEAAAARRGGQVVALPAADEADIPDMVASLAKAHHKQIAADSPLMGAILSRRDQDGQVAARSPLYLSLLLQRLDLLGREDYAAVERLTAVGTPKSATLSAYLADQVRALPADADGVYHAIVQKISAHFADGFAENVLCLLAASRFGLREQDIRGALQALGRTHNPADFAWLRHSLGGHLSQGMDQEWDFTHLNLRRLLKRQMPDAVRRVNSEGLVPYAYRALQDDPADNFIAREILYHAWLAGRADVAAVVLGANMGSGNGYPYADAITAILDLEGSRGGGTDAEHSFFAQVIDAARGFDLGAKHNLYCHLDRHRWQAYGLPGKFTRLLLERYVGILGPASAGQQHTPVSSILPRLFCYLGELAQTPEDEEGYFALAEQRQTDLEAVIGADTAAGSRSRLDQTIGDYWFWNRRDAARARPYYDRYLDNTRRTYEAALATGDEARVVEALNDYCVGFDRQIDYLIDSDQLEAAASHVRQHIALAEGAVKVYRSQGETCRRLLFDAYRDAVNLAKRAGDQASAYRYAVKAAAMLAQMHRAGDRSGGFRAGGIGAYYRAFADLVDTVVKPLEREGGGLAIAAEEVRPILRQFVTVAREFRRVAGDDRYYEISHNINVAQQAAGVSAVESLAGFDRGEATAAELRQVLKDSQESLMATDASQAKATRQRVTALMKLVRRLAAASDAAPDRKLVGTYCFNAANKLAVVGDTAEAEALLVEGAAYSRRAYCRHNSGEDLRLAVFNGIELAHLKAVFGRWDGFAEVFSRFTADFALSALVGPVLASGNLASLTPKLELISQRLPGGAPERRESLALAALLKLCQGSALQREAKFTGRGELFFPDRSVYQGDVKDGWPDGIGVLRWPRQFGDFAGRYEGEVRAGQPHGRGRREWADGRVLEGEWQGGDPADPRHRADPSCAASAYLAARAQAYLKADET